MTHAGTMDLGGNARTKQGGSRLPAVMLALAVVLAAIAAVWFATRAGVAPGTATRPIDDRSFDRIEAQRTVAATLSAREAYLNSIVDRAHAVPFVATLPKDLSVRRGYQVEIQSAAKLPDNVSARRGYPVVAAPAAALPDNLSARRGYPVVAAPAATLADDRAIRGGYWVAIQSTPLPDNLSVRRGYPVETQSAPTLSGLWAWRGQAAGAVAVPDDLSPRLSHRIESASSATSGTFHPGR
jgi:hypothetical protein